MKPSHFMELEMIRLVDMEQRMLRSINRASSRNARRCLMLLLPVAFAVGCALNQPPAEEEPIAVRPGGAVLVVRNRSWSTMHLYLLVAGQRFSLGMVTSQSERSFEIPPTAFANERDLVFMADPVGSVLAYVSDPILVQPGNRVRWTLQKRLSQSSVFIY